MLRNDSSLQKTRCRFAAPGDAAAGFNLYRLIVFAQDSDLLDMVVDAEGIEVSGKEDVAAAAEDEFVFAVIVIGSDDGNDVGFGVDVGEELRHAGYAEGIEVL